MARIFFFALLGQFCFLPYLDAITSSPKVQVYSRYPPDSGKDNYINCYVSGFHPPQITIKLIKDKKVMENVEESDLSFSNDWTFNRLVSAPFDPKSNSEFLCHVEHVTMKEAKVVKWDPENN